MRAGPWAGSSGTWGEEGKGRVRGEGRAILPVRGHGTYWARGFTGEAESTPGPKVWAQGAPMPPMVSRSCSTTLCVQLCFSKMGLILESPLPLL